MKNTHNFSFSLVLFLIILAGSIVIADSSEELMDKAFDIYRNSNFTNISNAEIALQAFDQVTLIEPDHQNAWLMKGLILYHRLERYEEAIEAFDKIIETVNESSIQSYNEFYSDSLDYKRECLNMLGRYEEAIEIADFTLDNDVRPGSESDRYNARGDYYFNISNYEKALESYYNASGYDSSGISKVFDELKNKNATGLTDTEIMVLKGKYWREPEPPKYGVGWGYNEHQTWGYCDGQVYDLNTQMCLPVIE